MFKHCLLAMMLAGIIYTVTPSVAQDNGGNNQEAAPAGAPEHGPGRGHMDPQKRTEMLAKHLKLNADQQAKVLDILKSQQSQMEGLRSDTSLSQQDRRSKMMDIHKASDDQIRALLTSDQQKKFDEMQAHQQQWRGHGEAGQPPSGQAAPSQQ